ncbi:MAG TPA: universal stress protein [Candidatus Binataceae bacterium]|jgi:nucleotide-binding universal stress UspA family protein|nr:universal stress protein [Candidatus Binataceae bacterium]
MKKLFRKILCPVSFDQNSISAVELACELAEGTDATIYLLHVVPAPPITARPIPMEPYPQNEHDARDRLKQVAHKHLEGKVKHEIFARTGDPARITIDMVEELGADSIVMATHGRTGVSHLILGSVAERVVRESPRPVLTVRGTAR